MSGIKIFINSPDAETIKLVQSMVNTTSAMCMSRPALTESKKGKGHLGSLHVRKKARVIVGTYDRGTNQIISFAD